jgi:hypothetical protein
VGVKVGSGRMGVGTGWLGEVAFWQAGNTQIRMRDDKK